MTERTEIVESEWLNSRTQNVKNQEKAGLQFQQKNEPVECQVRKDSMQKPPLVKCGKCDQKFDLEDAMWKHYLLSHPEDCVLPVNVVAQ